MRPLVSSCASSKYLWNANNIERITCVFINFCNSEAVHVSGGWKRNYFVYSITEPFFIYPTYHFESTDIINANYILGIKQWYVLYIFLYSFIFPSSRELFIILLTIWYSEKHVNVFILSVSTGSKGMLSGKVYKLILTTAQFYKYW